MYASLVILTVGLHSFVLGDHGNLRRNEVSLDSAAATTAHNVSVLCCFPDSLSLPSLNPVIGWIGEPPAPADDEVWDRYKCKGRKMMFQMSLSDFDVGQMLPNPQDTAKSPWENWHLDDWGYGMYDARPDYRNFQEGGFWGIAPWLRNAGISDKCVEEGGKWRASAILHWDPALEDQVPMKDQTYLAPDGVRRRNTGAYFYMSVTEEGGIMTQNRKGPWDSLKELHPSDYQTYELPDLQKSSDMMWAMWQTNVPEDKRRKIEFFITLTIENPTTLSLIRRALDSQGASLTRTGTRFDPNTDPGRALLGSPNGAGFAHFLIQRKLQVGLKTIDAIWVFECSNHSKSACMIFRAKDLAQPVPRPPDTAARSNRTSESEPITKENAEELREGGGSDALTQRRNEEKRNFIRVHTFRFDGNVTVWTEYM